MNIDLLDAVAILMVACGAVALYIVAWLVRDAVRYLIAKKKGVRK